MSQLWDELELEDATFAECSINNANHSFQVITPSRCVVLCADSRSEMESWAGALRGALHRGADVADLVARLSSGDHHWYAATHARPTFCNVCREPLGALGTAHALACELCKYKAHKRCAARAPPSCKWSTLASLGPHLVEDAEGNIIMPHQWLEGNLPVAAKCDICDKTCGSVLRLQDFRCVWCRKCVHANCRPGWRATCSLGPARASVVPPTRLHSVGPDDGWLPDRPPNASPLIVFVNSRSGDNQGIKFLRRFKQLLNPAQVFELSGAGPRLGLRLFRHFAPLRVLVCSGDGSVGWVLQEIDKLDMHRQVQTAVLPLGTGNDLARVLGWGASCDDAANLQQLLERYERASTKMLDRWSIMTFERALTAPPPPPVPPDLLDESTLLKNLQDIMQAGEVSPAASSALRAGCLRLAAAGERAGGSAARASHRLRRALSLLLHARTHLAHDHTRCRSWEPMETTSDSEPETQPVAEKGIIEKTEKEQLNLAARGCSLAGRADSVRRALRSLVRTLAHLCPQEAVDWNEIAGEGDKGNVGIESSRGGGGDSSVAGGLRPSSDETATDTLPVPRAFADSRRSSAASAVSAASLHSENIPDVDEDIAKLMNSQPGEQQQQTLHVEKPDPNKLNLSSPRDRLSISNLSSCDTSSCKNLFRPDTDRGPSYSSSLTVPNLVSSSDSDKRHTTVQGETYESDQLTIIDIDKPYTDDVHFRELSERITSASGDCTPERKLSSVDLEVDASSSEGSNISEDFSLISEIIDTKPEDLVEGGIGHIDSPEISDTTYANSETIHGESIMDDISSMLGQEVLLAMMGKNGDNETYTDDTTLFTSDTVSDIPMDSRNPSLERKTEGRMKHFSKIKKRKEPEVEKFGFENRVFYIENAPKADDQIKYCSLAQFEEGSDIARKSFRKQVKRSVKKRLGDDGTVKHLLPKTAEEQTPKEDSLIRASSKPTMLLNEEITTKVKDQVPMFPQVSVVVEPPSPSQSEGKKSLKNTESRMASVLNDIFEPGTDTLSVHSPEPNITNSRERRQSDNPKLLGSSDPEYGKFLSCSPAATRRISCGSLFKPGEPDKLSTSVSSIWGEGGIMGNMGSLKSDTTSERAKKLPIINPLVQLPSWPHVTQGFISQCLLANADALCAAVSPLMDPDDTLLEGFYEKAVMNNYFGIGIDAKITLDFHNKREEHPEKCRSRARNYMWYGVLGSKEWVNRTYRHLGQRVQLECDGQRIPLPELQGIVVLNISSFMGGTNFWGGTRADDIFLAPSFDDRILEVVAVFGSAQMAASRLINLQKHRIAQCRAVQINILGEECVPVQVDGEAWLQPPGCVRIIHKNRAQMLCRSRALETSLRAWDEKQQQKAQAGSSLSQSESAQLLALLDDVNTLVKHVKLACISEASSGGSALSAARRVAARADSLQDAEGRLLPPPQLRRLLAALMLLMTLPQSLGGELPRAAGERLCGRRRGGCRARAPGTLRHARRPRLPARGRGTHLLTYSAAMRTWRATTRATSSPTCTRTRYPPTYILCRHAHLARCDTRDGLACLHADEVPTYFHTLPPCAPGALRHTRRPRLPARGRGAHLPHTLPPCAPGALRHTQRPRLPCTRTRYPPTYILCRHAHLARCDTRNGLAYLHADEVPTYLHTLPPCAPGRCDTRDSLAYLHANEVPTYLHTLSPRAPGALRHTRRPRLPARGRGTHLLTYSAAMRTWRAATHATASPTCTRTRYPPTYIICRHAHLGAATTRDSLAYLHANKVPTYLHTLSPCAPGALRHTRRPRLPARGRGTHLLTYSAAMRTWRAATHATASPTCTRTRYPPTYILCRHAHLARCDTRDGLAYLHADEVPTYLHTLPPCVPGALRHTRRLRLPARGRGTHLLAYSVAMRHGALRHTRRPRYLHADEVPTYLHTLPPCVPGALRYTRRPRLPERGRGTHLLTYSATMRTWRTATHATASPTCTRTRYPPTYILCRHASMARCDTRDGLPTCTRTRYPPTYILCHHAHLAHCDTRDGLAYLNADEVPTYLHTLPPCVPGALRHTRRPRLPARGRGTHLLTYSATMRTWRTAIHATASPTCTRTRYPPTYILCHHAHLAHCDTRDGLAYLHADEVPKRGAGRWLRGRRSVSEGSSTSFTAAQVRNWGVKEVQTWLESMQLGEYSEVFAKHDVTGRELLSLARRDLRDLGITKVGHIKRILQGVKDLQ
ncbi:unnamed protein product [Parnassius apollo]|uniref:Diacylglycerol kinase n=1 Tax=Parnassius apollo TaxID=110799 RepID=A0A8S3Y7R5_PARAO|nr:unnamed protein product [Parnassius apollo]